MGESVWGDREGACVQDGDKNTKSEALCDKDEREPRTQKFCDSGLEVRVGPMVAMFFPPPFSPFNLGERCVGMAGGFRLFICGGTGGADRLPEGEGIARGGTPRQSGSGPGPTVSNIPIESLRMGGGTGRRSCVGGVLSSGPDRPR